MADTSGALWRQPLHVQVTVPFPALVLVLGAALAWIGCEGSRRVALRICRRAETDAPGRGRPSPCVAEGPRIARPQFDDPSRA
jgi:hypothetical protein